MTTLPRALEIVNGYNYNVLPFISQWQNIFYRTSIHTTGACPAFYPLGEGRRGLEVTTSLFKPSGWIDAAYDVIFDTHLINKHPREPEVTRQWRKSVYRPYQMAPLLESIGSTSATIFGDSKYTLSVEDTEDNEYIHGKNFEGKTFVDYFKHYFKAICEDPNSLFVVMPKMAGYLTPADKKKVEPTIKHIPSRDIIYIDDNEIIYREWGTPYAWFVNDIGYFRFEKRNDDKYYPMDANYGYYAHMLTYRPAHFAGGIWNTQKFYDSYLKPAQAYCDDFVSAWSDVQMINKEASHPYITEASTDCPSCNGHKQVSYCTACNSGIDNTGKCRCDEYAEGTWALVNCGSCHGSGQMSRNPADHTVVPKEDMQLDLIKVTEFSVAANIYLDEHAERVKLGIRKSLHQDHIDEAQSGIAKDIDRSGTFLYRSTVSDGVWGLIEKCLIDVLSIRNTVSSNGKVKPEIPKYILVKPTDFDLKTENDLLEEYKESTDAKTPEWVRQRQIEQYVDKCFGGDDVMVKMATVINEMDAYSVTNIVDKLALLSGNGISPREFQFSNALPKMLKQIVREKGSNWFVKADYNSLKTEVDAIFDTIPELEQKQEIVKTNINA